MANITETANLCGLKRENFQTTINVVLLWYQAKTVK